MIQIKSLLYLLCFVEHKTIVFSTSDKIHNSIYREIDYDENVNTRTKNSFNPCIAMSVEEQTTGCQGNHKGNIGILKMEKDLDNHIPDDKITVMVSKKNFTQSFLDSIENNDKIAGMIVDDSNQDSDPDGFSSDLKCPGRKKGLYNENYGKDYETCEKGPTWNEPGFSDLKDYRFPIFRVKNKTLIENLKNCYDLTSKTKPKCAIEMKAAQHVSKPTKDCLHRKSVSSMLALQMPARCSPLQGVSTFTLLKNSNNNQLKSVWVTAALDGKSMFYEDSPMGSRSLSLVLFLAVAEAIGNGKDVWKNKLEKQIVFAGLDGESYDYIGSSSVLKLIDDEVFPMNLTSMNSTNKLPGLIKTQNLDIVIEIGEIMNQSENLYLHIDDIADADTNINANEQTLRDRIIVKTGDIVKKSKSGYPLPPGSVHSFKKNKFDIKALLLSDFEEGFQSKLYNSRLDENNNNLDDSFAEKLATVGTGLAKSILKESSSLVDAEIDTKVKIEKARVLELAKCFQGDFVKNPCDDFLRLLPVNQFLRFKNRTELLTDKNFQKMFEKLNNRYVGTLGSADAIYANMFKNIQSNSVMTWFVLHLLARTFGENKGSIDVNLYDLDNSDSVNKLREDTEKLCAKLEYDYSVDNLTVYDVLQNKIVCYHSISLVKTAISPAFKHEGDRWSLNDNSKDFSTYTESVWSEDSFSLRYFFLYENSLSSAVVFIGGIVLMSTVSFLNSWINKNSDILFAI